MANSVSKDTKAMYGAREECNNIIPGDATYIRSVLQSAHGTDAQTTVPPSINPTAIYMPVSAHNSNQHDALDRTQVPGNGPGQSVSENATVYLHRIYVNSRTPTIVEGTHRFYLHAFPFEHPIRPSRVCDLVARGR